jgi:small subunit ribosomal protein S17
MAETPEETPENLQEEVASAAEGGRGDERSEADAAEGGRGDERSEAAAASEAGAGETTTAPARDGATRRERLEAKRAERRAAAGRRPPRTPEERAAERAERRAAVAKQRRAYRARTKAKRAERRAAAPPPPEPQRAPEHPASLRSSSASPGGRPKVRQGVVTSDAGDKTIVVRIDVVGRHKRYHKILRSSVKLSAHDERNDAHPGDTVRVVECRPMSRTKRWRLVEILERAR